MIEPAKVRPELDLGQRDGCEDREGHEDRAQVDRQRTCLRACGRLDGQAVQSAHRAVEELLAGGCGGERRLDSADLTTEVEEYDAGDERDGGHQQRPAHAMPECEAVARLAEREALGVRPQKVCEWPAPETPDKRRQAEEAGDRGHAPRGLVPVEDRAVILAGEGPPPPPQRVGDGQGRAEDQGEREHGRDERGDGVLVAGDEIGECLEGGFLGDEPDERRHASHRQRRETTEEGEPRDSIADTAQLV